MVRALPLAVTLFMLSSGCGTTAHALLECLARRRRTKRTTGDYYSDMAKTAGVKDLKAKLSQYLRDVKHGETVLVTEHGQVVAKLVPLRDEEGKLSKVERERRQLVADGLVSHLGTQEEGDWPEPTGHGVSREDLEAALEADREDRV